MLSNATALAREESRKKNEEPLRGMKEIAKTIDSKVANPITHIERPEGNGGGKGHMPPNHGRLTKS